MAAKSLRVALASASVSVLALFAGSAVAQTEPGPGPLTGAEIVYCWQGHVQKDCTLTGIGNFLFSGASAHTWSGLQSFSGNIALTPLTTHGLLLGEGASPLNAVLLGNGQVLIGQTGADPLAYSISGDATLAANGKLTVLGANGVTFGPLATASAASLVPHGVMFAESGAVPNEALLSAGQILVGQGVTADPLPQTLSGDATISALGVLTVNSTHGTNFGPLATIASVSAHQVVIGEGAGLSSAALGSGQLLIGQGAAADPAAQAVSGDAVLSAAGVLTVSKLGGVAVGPLATAPGSSLTAHGVLIGEGAATPAASAALAAGQILVGQSATSDPLVKSLSGDVSLAASGAVTVSSFGGVAFGSAAGYNVGTSGSAVPLLSGANTWTGKQTFPASTAASAGFNCGGGVSPTVPGNYDLWCNSTGMYVQIGSTTYQLASASGSGNVSSFDGRSGVVTLQPGDLTGMLTAPGAIGGTTPGTGAFTTLSASGASTLAGVSASSLSVSGTSTLGVTSLGATTLSGITGSTQCLQVSSAGLVSGTGTTCGTTLTSGLVTTALGYTPAHSGANSDITSLTGLTTALGVSQGGTGATSLAAHGVVIGEGTSSVATATLAAGQLLIGQSTVDPEAMTVSGDATLTNTGTLTVTKTNGVAFTSAATTAIGTSGATIPLLNGGNTWSGNNTFSLTPTAPNYGINGAAATNRALYFETAGVLRWSVYEANDAEGGSNTGSTLYIGRYADAGTGIDNPLGINRATGLVTINDGLGVTGTTSLTGALNVSGGAALSSLLSVATTISSSNTSANAGGLSVYAGTGPSGLLSNNWSTTAPSAYDTDQGLMFQNQTIITGTSFSASDQRYLTMGLGPALNGLTGPAPFIRTASGQGLNVQTALFYVSGNMSSSGGLSLNGTLGVGGTATLSGGVLVNETNGTFTLNGSSSGASVNSWLVGQNLNSGVASLPTGIYGTLGFAMGNNYLTGQGETDFLNPGNTASLPGGFAWLQATGTSTASTLARLSTSAFTSYVGINANGGVGNIGGNGAFYLTNSGGTPTVNFAANSYIQNNGSALIVNGVSGVYEQINAGGFSYFGGRVQSTAMGNIGQLEFPSGTTNGTSYYNAGWRNDGTTIYLLESAPQTTAAAAYTSSWSALRPFAVTLSSGAVAIDATGAGVTFGGNVTMPSFSITSDRRLKTNIKPLVDQGKLLDAVQPVEYDKQVGDGSTTRHERGVIAQDVQKAAPDLVHTGTDEQKTLSVDYNGLFVSVLAEVKAQRAEIKVLQRKVAMLEAARHARVHVKHSIKRH